MKHSQRVERLDKEVSSILERYFEEITRVKVLDSLLLIYKSKKGKYKIELSYIGMMSMKKQIEIAIYSRNEQNKQTYSTFEECEFDYEDKETFIQKIKEINKSIALKEIFVPVKE